MRQHSCSDALPIARVLDVARDPITLPLANQLNALCQAARMSPTEIAGAYMRLAFGRGRVSFADFVKLRLFDPDFHAGADLRAYVGQRRNRDICVTANYRHDWLGILSNKMASCSYLRSYGLPTIPVAAVYAPGLTVGGPSMLRDRTALEAFLSTSDAYPLFGKPVESMQSLGSIALKGRVGKDRILEKPDGTTTSLDGLLSDIVTHYSAGYVFQPLMSPDAAIASLCGDRLACMRVITALTEDGPQAIRAVLKIPAGPNSADNYWRSGNLLAQIDLETGRILRVTTGSGLDTRHLATHPDSNTPLVGFQTPAWPTVIELAIAGAGLMRHVPLIGWDIACTDCGPVIVEMNETPDLFLVQFADRRGILDRQFDAFLAFQARNAARHTRFMKTSIAKL